MKKKILISLSTAVCSTALWAAAMPLASNAIENGTTVYSTSSTRNQLLNEIKSDADSMALRGDVGCSGDSDWCAWYVTNVLSNNNVSLPDKVFSRYNVTNITYGYMVTNRFHCRGDVGFTCTVNDSEGNKLIVDSELINATYDTSYIPQPGDLIMFNWSDSYYDGPDHIGFVEYVDGNIVHTIEGNSGADRSRVMRNTYSLTDSDIYGYACPDYGDDEYTSNTQPSLSVVTASDNSRARAVEEARVRINKSKRPADYYHTTIEFVNEVLNAAGAKSFYAYPTREEVENGTASPSVVKFVNTYKENGAFFEKGSGYTPRIGDVAVLESNGNFDDGADKLAIISGYSDADGEHNYVIIYDTELDRVIDSAECPYEIIGYCTPFYKYDDLGDCNFDGVLNRTDIDVQMSTLDNNSDTFKTYQKLCMDINESDTVNRIDLFELQSKISKSLTFEGEETDYSQVGTTNDDSIYAEKDKDSAAYLCYGPYLSGFAPGDKMATFNLKIDDITSDNEVVATIDAFDSAIGEVIATREIKRKEFITANSYQKFNINFYCPESNHELEFRVFYHGKSDLSFDNVEVTDVDTIKNVTYEAETDLSTRIDQSNKKEPNGVVATVDDKSDYLVYGPYINKLSLGTYEVGFQMKVDNNDNDSLGIAKIEIYDFSKDKVVAEKIIKRTDFAAANKYQQFKLYFTNANVNDTYEFRVFYIGNGKVTVDKVDLLRANCNMVQTFEAESDVIRKNDKTKVYKEDGKVVGYYVSDKDETMYGPYTTNVPLGNNIASFKLKYDGSASADDVIAYLDVRDATDSKVLVQKEIKKNQFHADGSWSVFNLPYSMKQDMLGHEIEFRVMSTNKGKIIVDNVTSRFDMSSEGEVYNSADLSSLNTTSRKVLMTGVDISNPGQHRNVNWNVLKTEADFAIIRLGFRYLSSPYAIETDESFEFNYGEAQRVGMPVGIYFYSNAATVDEAIEEANHCLAVLKNRKIDFPVYFDLETARSKSAGAAQVSAMIDAFCGTITNGGYTAGFYVNLDTYRNYVDSNLVKKYALWMAQYNETFDFSGPAGMWQKTDKGTLSCLAEGVTIDINECYVDYPSILN